MNAIRWINHIAMTASSSIGLAFLDRAGKTIVEEVSRDFSRDSIVALSKDFDLNDPADAHIVANRLAEKVLAQPDVRNSIAALFEDAIAKMVSEQNGR